MLKDQIGYLPLDKITPGRLMALYDWLAEPGRNKRSGGKLSNKTIREYHMFISSVMSRAEKDGRVEYNPCKKADPPKREQHKAEILQPEEVERMLNLLENEPPQMENIHPCAADFGSQAWGDRGLEMGQG